MRPIFLIGYMGCGKTTLGRAVAAATGLHFIDLDEAIERHAGMTVTDIFRLHGESAFREAEAAMLREASTKTDVIIATGGGTPLRPGAMTMMNESGLTVWLQADVERLLARLYQSEQRAKRPLLAGKSDRQIRRTVIDGLNSRLPYYSQAAITFDSSRLDTLNEIKRTTQKFIHLLETRNL